MTTIREIRLEELNKLAQVHGWEVRQEARGRVINWHASRWSGRPGAVDSTRYTLHVMLGSRGSVKAWFTTHTVAGSDDQGRIPWLGCLSRLESYGAKPIVLVSE